jgi:hypothetical protein
VLDRVWGLFNSLLPATDSSCLLLPPHASSPWLARIRGIGSHEQNNEGKVELSSPLKEPTSRKSQPILRPIPLVTLRGMLACDLPILDHFIPFVVRLLVALATSSSDFGESGPGVGFTTSKQ